MSHLQIAWGDPTFLQGGIFHHALSNYDLISLFSKLRAHLHGKFQPELKFQATYCRATENIPAQVKTQPGVKVPARLAQTGLELSGKCNQILAQAKKWACKIYAISLKMLYLDFTLPHVISILLGLKFIT